MQLLLMLFLLLCFYHFFFLCSYQSVHLTFNLLQGHFGMKWPDRGSSDHFHASISANLCAAISICFFAILSRM
jgi:hypothetical protein